MLNAKQTAPITQKSDKKKGKEFKRTLNGHLNQICLHHETVNCKILLNIKFTDKLKPKIGLIADSWDESSVNVFPKIVWLATSVEYMLTIILCNMHNLAKTIEIILFIHHVASRLSFENHVLLCKSAVMNVWWKYLIERYAYVLKDFYFNRLITEEVNQLFNWELRFEFLFKLIRGFGSDTIGEYTIAWLTTGNHE